MVFRDYMVRCKKCNIPYIPDNVSRIRTCVFCRRSLVTQRSDRLNVLVSDIRRYSETQNGLPTKEILKTWIKLKFEVEDSTANSYIKELESSKIIGFIEEECIKKVKLLNLIKQPVNT